jgi:methyltransferase (TIGR00027 family)
MSGQAHWDIVTGVGLTALAVAAGRAMESRRRDSLVSDPYAESFVRAAPSPIPIPTRPGPTVDPGFAALSSYVGLRSRFLDEFLADASASGVDQIVVLAAGLDTRAFRMCWPAATTLYELDAPKVLEFKNRILSAQGAQAACERRVVAVDLRDDWPAALQEAGFDASSATAWLAEGLMPFLPDEVKERLFLRVRDLSAAGSRIAIESVEGDVAAHLRDPSFQDMCERVGFDLADLWPGDQHLDVARWWADHGWAPATTRVPQIAERYGRRLDTAIPELIRANVLVTARR